MMLSAPLGVDKTLLFFVEVRRNKILSKKFSCLPPEVINKMSKQITKFMESANPEYEYTWLIEHYQKMKIVEEEFDEFVKIYIKICSTDLDHAKIIECKMTKLKR